MPPKRRRNEAVEPSKNTKKVKISHTATRRSPRNKTSDEDGGAHSDAETRNTPQTNSRAVKPPRTGWTPTETGYLELLHEKLKRAAKSDPKFRMPDNTRMLEEFNKFFEYRNDIRDKKGVLVEPLGTRNMGQLTSYMGRKGSKLHKLRKNLSQYNTSNDAETYFPAMTDAEIQSYMDGHGLIHVDEDDAIPEKHTRALQSSSQRPQKRPKLPPAQTSSQAQQHTTDNAEPKKKPRWVKPPETPVVPDTPEYIASLKAKGYTWSYIPESSTEAIELHRTKHDKNPADTTWISQATKGLDDRIKRRSSPGFHHEFFNRDAIAKYDSPEARKKFEDWHEISARVDGAAAVTGLLNTADVPPIGYTGDVRDLHRKRLLPENELEVADARDDGIGKRHDAMERQRLLKVRTESRESRELKRGHDRAERLQEKDLFRDSGITDYEVEEEEEGDDEEEVYEEDEDMDI
jgi:hypothetical protein